MCERKLETEHNCNILTPTLMAISVVSYSFFWCSNRRPWGPRFLLSAGLLYHILSSNSSNHQLSDFLSWPSNIIVQRPLNRPLNLWNGMFDRHQAEITLMQFRGHSLPVHQSMSVSWAFSLSHFISQIRLRDFFRLLAIGMCHFLPVHHFGMTCFPGPKVNI